MWGICGIVFLAFFDERHVYGGFLPGWRNPGEEWVLNGLSDEPGAGNAADQTKKTPERSEDHAGNDADSTNGAEGAGEGKNGETAAADMTEEDGSENGDKDGNDPEAGEEKSFQGFLTVEDEYFSDAVFIGDSRTVGLGEYGGLEDVSTFYASKGLTIYTLPNAKIVSVEGKREKITVFDALQDQKFKKIYIMVGINELGTGNAERFLNAYWEVLQEFHRLQPDAVIYIQAILKVTTKRSEQGDYITNEGIDERNEAIKSLADNVTYFYLDANPAICDETGGMREEYTTDGVHLKGKDIYIWKDFLKEHAVVLDGQGG